jgi:arabinogalactan endo-1,4-beta-galactosidase
VKLADAKLLSFAAMLCACIVGRASATPSPFYMGGDISLETYMQGQYPTVASPRAHFFDSTTSTVEQPLHRIMYDRGANLFRLRVFVNPQSNYTSSPPSTANFGAIQSTAYDIAVAQQIKADCPNAKLVLDFHYSDTWADPGKQFKPQNLGGSSDPGADWRGLDLPTLNTTVRNYTRDTLTAFQSAGVMPDIVQLGNETIGGMLWQTGPSGAAAVGGKILYQNNTYTGLGLPNDMPTQSQTNQSWRDFGGLLNSAIAGVRDVQNPPDQPPGQRIPIALSIDHGDRSGQPQSFYANIQNASLGNVTDFDIEGVDFYPTSGNLATTMKSNLTALANTNYSANLANPNQPLKKIMLLETNSPYQNSGVGDANQFPKTQAGQLAEFNAVRDMIYQLPHDDGEGVLWWYPEAVVPGSNYNNGATALFDSNNAACHGGGTNHCGLPALDAMNITLVPGDYDHDGVVDAGDYTIWRDTFGSTTDLRADGDGDQVVGQGDFDFWVNHFPTSAGAGASAVVPEPSSWALLAIAVAGVALCGGRTKLVACPVPQFNRRPASSAAKRW